MTDIPQEPPASTGSSPSVHDRKSKEAPSHEPGARSKIATRIEFPKLPSRVISPFDQLTTEEVEVGNKRYDFVQMNEGYIGHRFRRSALEEKPTYINLRIDNIRGSIFTLTGSEVARIIRDKGVLDSPEIQRRATQLANVISNGTMIVMYLKLQELHFTLWDEFDKFAEGPKIPKELEIPTPLALCIQQLGLVKIASLRQELSIAPTVPEADNRYFCDPTVAWNPVEHAESVEYMKSLGMTFCAVNLKVKIGSTWWLYRQEEEDDVVRLSCPLPESNFTEAGAVMHSMFFTGALTPTVNEIADLGPLGTRVFGIMMRDPRVGIHTSSFHALSGSSSHLW